MEHMGIGWVRGDAGPSARLRLAQGDRGDLMALYFYNVILSGASLDAESKNPFPYRPKPSRMPLRACLVGLEAGSLLEGVPSQSHW